MMRLLRLVGRSVIENDRFSPRLLTVFAFVLAALLLLYKGATTLPTVVGGVIISAWPPEYIWSGLILLIAGLLGLGKVVNAWSSKAATPDTQITADTIQADVQTSGPVNVGPTSTMPPNDTAQP